MRGDCATKAANRNVRLRDKLIKERDAEIARLKSENARLAQSLEAEIRSRDRKIKERISFSLSESGVRQILDMSRNQLQEAAGMYVALWFRAYRSLCGNEAQALAVKAEIDKAVCQRFVPDPRTVEKVVRL